MRPRAIHAVNHAGPVVSRGSMTQPSASIRARTMPHAAPRDGAVSIRTRELGYLLRGGRRGDPTQTVRPARVRRGVSRRAYATLKNAPSGTTPLLTYRQSAITSLRATATIPNRPPPL